MNRDAVLLGVVAIAAILLMRKVVGAVADAYSPGGAAYEAGDTIQDALVPGVDSLGTWSYGVTHGESSPLSLFGLTGIGAPAGAGSAIGRSIGEWFRDLFAVESDSATAPAASAPKPGPAPAYDYGFGAGSGPLRLPVGTAGVADGYSVFWGT